MLPAHQLQGELAISVPRHRHREIITGQGMWHLPVYTVVSNDLFCTFKYFVLPNAKPYKKLQKCQKPLEF